MSDSSSPTLRRRQLPEIPGPVQTLGLLWRRLRKMSTALILLFALAAASVIATFIPQQPLIPSTVAQWLSGEAGPGSAVARAFDWLGLFNVFGSWWFTTLVVLLFTSLTGCLIPRWRGFLRLVRKPPPAGRSLDRLSERREFFTAASPDEALALAASTLRGYRHRRVAAADTASGNQQLAAQRGHAREGASLVFHTAFYLLLAGVIIGKVFGFEGQVNLPEGEAFADTRIAYDLAEPGRLFGLDDHRGFVVELEDFDVSYFPNFTPKDFVSRVRVLEGGEVVREGVTRVNHPFVHDGMKLYQLRFGMAPRIIVRAGATVLFDEKVMLSDAGGGVWTGAAKVSLGGRNADGEAGPQIALDLVFLPDAAVTDRGVPFTRSPEPKNPRLIGELYVGQDLGLDQPIAASSFNRAGGQVVGDPAVLAPGSSVDMANGNLTVEFAELKMWSGFQVTHAPGRWILLFAAILLLAGLIPSLHSYRRRVWVEVVAQGTGSRVVCAGVALQRKATFTEEFATLSDRLRAALPPALTLPEAEGPLHADR